MELTEVMADLRTNVKLSRLLISRLETRISNQELETINYRKQLSHSSFNLPSGKDDLSTFSLT